MTKEDWKRICEILHRKLTNDSLSWVTYKVCGQEFLVDHINLERSFIVLKGFELLTFDRLARKRKFKDFDEAFSFFTIYRLDEGVVDLPV